MHRNEFSISQASIGRDCFYVILPKYKLTIRKRFRAPRMADSSHRLPQCLDLTRTLLLEHSDRLWVSDITYITIWLPDGSYVFCYLFLMAGAYTREIIEYCVGDTLRSCCTVEALEMAIRRTAAREIKDLIHHSDRGVRYVSADYIAILRHDGIPLSMTEGGNPKDNAIAERMNDIIKNELLQGMCFSSTQRIRKAIVTAAHFYNNEGSHISLDILALVQAGEIQGPIRKGWISYREKYPNVALA